MALAESPAHYQAVASVFEELKRQEIVLQSALAEFQEDPPPNNVESEVQAALRFAEDLVERAGNCHDFTMARELFSATNGNVFLSFRPVKVKKRTLNKLAGGVVTFGAAPAPIDEYTGPTNRKNVNGTTSKKIEDSSTEKPLKSIRTPFVRWGGRVVRKCKSGR